MGDRTGRAFAEGSQGGVGVGHCELEMVGLCLVSLVGREKWTARGCPIVYGASISVEMTSQADVGRWL